MLTKEQKKERIYLEKISLEYIFVVKLLLITWDHKSLNPNESVDFYLRNDFENYYRDYAPNKPIFFKKKELKELCSITLWDASVNHKFYKTAISWVRENEYCVKFLKRFEVSHV